MSAITQNPEVDLISALAEGEESARKYGWVSMEVAMEKLGVSYYQTPVHSSSL